MANVVKVVVLNVFVQEGEAVKRPILKTSFFSIMFTNGYWFY